VRELQNLIRRIAAIYADDTISRAMIEQEISAGNLPTGAPVPTPGPSAQFIGEFVEHWLARYFASFGNTLPPAGLYDRMLAELEVPLINASLAATAGNQIRAAELLGINRNTLRAKIRDHGISVVRGAVRHAG
jgi:two-component system nitrogen regulation response regulator GlnG